MKRRTGLVSNSSSSSFTCDCCGENYSGMDAWLNDAEMFECEHNHLFCECHALGRVEEDEEDYRDNYPAKFCPICQLKDFTDGILAHFLLHKLGLTEDEIKEEIRFKFKDLEEMYSSLKG